MPSVSCRELLGRVRALGLRPRRHLGQNFLIDDGVVERILHAASLREESFVLEVGGGHGALSLPLAERCGTLLVVEKDPLLASHLRELLSPYPGAQVVEGDVLRLNLKETLPEGAVVVSNLPYSISSPFMFKLWDEGDAVERFYLMFQREVARRLVASPGTKEYGVLSVLFSLTFRVRIIFGVSKNSFWPRPEVDSAVVEGIREGTLPPSLKLSLRRVLDGAFPYRRKRLVKALRMGIPQVDWEAILKEAGVPADVRPDALEPEGWLAIAKLYEKLLI